MLKWNSFLLRNRSCFHTNCRLDSKPEKVLRKIMGGNKKKKYYSHYEAPVLPYVATGPGKVSLETKITGNPRRTSVLNKLFMKHVTDIMANGEYSKELLGYGIEINKVKISCDYKILNVFWVAKESEKSDEINRLLSRNAGHLAHELSSLQLMGRIPTIIFVKDRTYSKVAEVQELLAQADFGEDFEQTDAGDHLKSEIDVLLTTFDSNIKEKIIQTEVGENKTEDNHTDDERLPPMPQNVLGLDHAYILQKIKKGMAASKAKHRSSDETNWAEWNEFKATQPINENPIEFHSHQEQRKRFKEFLRTRQILLTKQRRLDKKWSAEQDYLEEELRERLQRSLKVENEVEEPDFILEEDVQDCKDIKSEK